MIIIIREESAHAINGVPGRRFAVTRHAGRTTLASQKWRSTSRPIAEYGRDARLSVEICVDDECRNGHNTFTITAEVRIPGRRDIEAGGCLYEDIARVFPELAPLIKWHLVSTDGPMHYPGNVIYHAREHGPTHAWVYYRGPRATDPLGLGEDGTEERLLGYLGTSEASKAEGQPGYRVKWDDKTAKVRNLDYARNCAVWPEATDEQLCAPEPELQTVLIARLPALLQSFRNDIEAAGFLWSI